MGVSKNNGTPKWMVKIMVPNPMNKWMIWGVKVPLFFGSTSTFCQELKIEEFLQEARLEDLWNSLATWPSSHCQGDELSFSKVLVYAMEMEVL